MLFYNVIKGATGVTLFTTNSSCFLHICTTQENDTFSFRKINAAERRVCM